MKILFIILILVGVLLLVYNPKKIEPFINHSLHIDHSLQYNLTNHSTRNKILDMNENQPEAPKKKILKK